MIDRLRVGVVGGGIGQQHIHAFQSLPAYFEVVAICDLDQGKGGEVADAYQIPYVTPDFALLCGMAEVDVIDICTPSYLHAQQIESALAAGKHVICEKPVAGSLKEVDDLIRVQTQAGKQVMPIFQYRFGHGVQKLKFLIDQGLTGRAFVTTVETAWRRRAGYYAVPWRGRWATELGGALVTLAVHAHDVLNYILGPARSVFARTATLVNSIETEDCVVASLEMVDGSLASLTVTTGSAVEISRHRFCFSQLTAESNLAPYNNTADPWTFTGDDRDVNQKIEETLARFEPMPERFAGQFLRFYHALRTRTGLPVTLADARISLELITAIYSSAQTGQIVTLPLTEDHPAYADWRPFS